MDTLLLTVAPYTPPPIWVDAVQVPANLIDTRASTATYIAQPGNMAIAPINTVRGDWSTGSGAVLIEGAATNYIPDSMGFSIAWNVNTTGGATAAPTTAVAPLLAGATVMAHTRTVGSGPGLTSAAWFALTAVGTAIVTVSAWVYFPPGTTATGASMELRYPFILGQGRLGLDILGDSQVFILGSSSLGSAYLSPSSFPMSGGDLPASGGAITAGAWQRIWTAVSVGANAALQPTLLIAGGDGAALYSTCWQVEVGTPSASGAAPTTYPPTSYIPTSGTIATRAADIISYGPETYDSWDLCLDANGNLAVATEPYALAQDAASAIRTFAGECYYDTTLGVPYFGEVLGQAPPLALLKSLWNAAALTVPDVATAQTFISGINGRNVTGQVQITSTSGATSAATF